MRSFDFTVPTTVNEFQASKGACGIIKISNGFLECHVPDFSIDYSFDRFPSVKCTIIRNQTKIVSLEFKGRVSFEIVCHSMLNYFHKILGINNMDRPLEQSKIDTSVFGIKSFFKKCIIIIPE